MQKNFTRISLMVFFILIVGGTLFSAVQGFLAVEAIDGVQVYVNGEMKGITVGGSSVLMLDPGSYRITLQKEGYSSTTQTVTIKAGEATNLKVNMTKPQVRGEALGADDKTVVLGQKTGTVEIRSVPFRGADIQINGVSYGQTDRRLTNMPVGPIRVYVTYAGKRLYGTFEVKENRTTQLQANYATEPAQIIPLYDATFILPNLPEGVKAELVGAYGTGVITSGQQTRVMGARHTVRYTYGKEYIELADQIDLEESTYVRLGVPDMTLVAKALPSYTVAFDSGGGNSVPPLENAMHGMPVKSPSEPTRSGYVFGGWYKDKSFEDKWNFGTDVVVADMTLYAKWRDYYNKGDIGPAGGYIFYDKGSYSDGWRYLESAPEDYDFSGVWGGYKTSVGGTGTAIGTGKENTEKIIAKFGNAEPNNNKTVYATKLCADLVVTKDGVRYDDWFLPSKDELDLIRQNLYLKKTGGFSFNGYWSSSESSANYAWGQYFLSGIQSNAYRDDDYRVRPVRAF